VVFAPLVVAWCGTSTLSWDCRRGGVGGVSEKERRTWAPTKVVARFREVPSTEFPPLAPPSMVSSVERKRNGPTSLRRGEGRLWVDDPGSGQAGAMGDEGGGSGRGKMKPTSTVDVVDVGFKLRSHSQ